MAALLSGNLGPRDVRGRPTVVEGPGKEGAVEFDGKGDALLVARNPLAGAPGFTVEMIFQVAPGGASEQRVLHVQAEGSSDRLLLETRRGDPAGKSWYADTIVSAGSEECILADPRRRHATGAWQVLAVVCDGEEMRHFVDGQEELRRPCRVPRWTEGVVCLGMRANAITPFRGKIAAVRFSRWARIGEELWAAPGHEKVASVVEPGGSFL